MNEQINTDPTDVVVAVEGTPEFLKQVSDKLAKDGEAFIQTDEEVGTDGQPLPQATVH